MATLASSPEKAGHRRNRSATVLKAIMTPRSHKRAPSDGTMLSKPKQDENIRPSVAPQLNTILPFDHPHAGGGRVLEEIQNPSGAPGSQSPRKSRDIKNTNPGSLHKKTKSSLSLRSLGKDKDKAPKVAIGNLGEKSTQRDPKKIKSTNGLSSVFSLGKSSKSTEGTPAPAKDKENCTPPSSAVSTTEAPIWAQYRSPSFQELLTTTSVPLNDRRSVEEEIARFTPSNYSPSKQRNFHGSSQPTLLSRNASGPRPKSEYLPASSSMYSLIENVQRKISGERDRHTVTKNPARVDKKEPPKMFTSSSTAYIGSAPSLQPTPQQKGARVRAAVAAFNGKIKDGATQEKVDPVQLATEFEAVLDSRNIPESVRPKMRGMADHVKADFIRKNRIETSKASQIEPSRFAQVAETLSKRPILNRSGTSDSSAYDEDGKTPVDDAQSSPSKRGRPRSRTFTFSKGDSPTKKQKSDGLSTTRSEKSTTLPKSPSMRSLSTAASVKSTSSKSSKAALPDEFVSYLNKTNRPQDVEIGKLHKLRLLLRNETVGWVDAFISQGGMKEVIGLISRIMGIEWREEHEDALLHEALLCLKGLCTTDLALRKLCEFEATLFPSLLGMLFDEERKGPSEFTTREIIIKLLFTHLCAAKGSQLVNRTETILSYLKDPTPPEEARPLPFILEMHQPRPYRKWCREIVNVTKEVFWIFLHHLNVIPLPSSNSPLDASIRSEGSTAVPSARSSSRPSTSNGQKDNYTALYFPQPRPPVPAAPYIGGVEWDATQYLATHMDLLNGIIASLPTMAERNALRTELRASGFEKVLGGALRTCKEKFYGHIHDVLKEWVAAALADEWDVKAVRMGECGQSSPSKTVKGGSPNKKKEAPLMLEAPKMDLPNLNLGFEQKPRTSQGVVDEWLGV